MARLWRHYDVSGPRRSALLPGVYALLDVCHASDSQQLLQALDPGGRTVLKVLRADHAAYHQYKGKL